MRKPNYLEKASGPLFFVGFMVSKLQYLPFAAAAAAFRFISLGIYLAAYSAWFAASYKQKEHERAHDQWYGFAKIKEQFLFSSFIGFIATVMSVGAVFVPALFPPAAWLFVLGNIIWSIAEYHKLHNPPADKKFSYAQQEAYMSYAASTAAISFVTASSATIMFFFPPIAIPVTVFSLLLCAGLSTLAFEYWLNSSFGDHEPAPVPSSYNLMNADLGLKSSLENTFDNTPVPSPAQNPHPPEEGMPQSDTHDEDFSEDSDLTWAPKTP